MRLLIAALSALTLAACNQAAAPEQETSAPEQTEQAVAPNNCPATASGSWQGLQVEASATGSECATAEATIVIRSGEQTLWSETYPSNQVIVLAGAGSVEDMQRRLNEWVNPPGAALNSTGDLPQWAAGAANPGGEFPFYVEEGVDRARYQAARSRDAPMFCYVQGMESLACVVLENGAITKLGVQSFPG
jgi:hypothetical protein